jgi:hypothetical protein
MSSAGKPMVSNSIPKIVRSTRICFSLFSGPYVADHTARKAPNWANNY